MNASRILIGAMLGLSLVACGPVVWSPAVAGDKTVVAKTWDLTNGYQIPAAGDTVVTGPTSTPASGAIALTATALQRTACVYSKVIDLTESQHGPDGVTGPAKGVAGMALWASQASGTVGVSVTALYGVASTMVTTPVDLSSTTANDRLSFYADAYGTQAAQTDKTKIRWYTNQVPRNARFVRFLLENRGGVALTIPAGGWRYVSP